MSSRSYKFSCMLRMQLFFYTLPIPTPHPHPHPQFIKSWICPCSNDNNNLYNFINGSVGSQYFWSKNFANKTQTLDRHMNLILACIHNLTLGLTWVGYHLATPQPVGVSTCAFVCWTTCAFIIACKTTMGLLYINSRSHLCTYSFTYVANDLPNHQTEET